MSRTYPELKIEIARLEAKAEGVRRFEFPAVISELNQLIDRYELTEAMIFGAIHKEHRGKPRTVLVPKYVDQATGNTWTGRGLRPSWMTEALSVSALAEKLLVS